MKLFLKNIFLFSGLFVVYFGINYVINTKIIEDTKPEINTNTLIIGASDVQAAIDPVFFDSAKNIAQLGETLFISYWKLKSLLETSSIDTVLLGITHAQFSTSFDYVMSAEKSNWAKNVFRKTYPIEELEKLQALDIDKKSYYLTLFNSMCLYPKRKHHHYIGEYANHDPNASNISNYAINIGDHYLKDGKEREISQTAIHYMNAIIELCKENKIAIVVVATPMHAKYLEKVPTLFIQNFETQKENLANQGIKILDYTFANYNDDEFYDSCHLNGKGAKKFTAQLKKDLAQNYLSKRN